MEYKKFLRPVIVGALLSILVFISYSRGVLDGLELKALDLRFKLRGSVAPRLPIVLVSIDQDSFDELALPWPWPRSLHATLIGKLAQNQAKLIALDILFGEPKAEVEEDRQLARAIGLAGNVILAAELTEVASDFGPRTTMSLPLPLLREQALAYGFINLPTDQDGVVRSAHPTLHFQDRIFSSFAYQIFQLLAGEKFSKRQDTSASPYLINFRGPARTYPVVPYYRVLRDEIEPAFFHGKIIMVGAFAPSLHDIFPTPFSASRPTAGVEIQANFVETLVANKPIARFAGGGYALVFFLLSGLAIFVALSSRPMIACAAIIALAAGSAFGALYFFAIHDLWIPIVPCLLGIVASYGGITLDQYVREQKERMQLRATFAKYVSPDVVEEILQDRAGIGMGGRRRHITVLFSDIRGFTSISEQIGPEQVVALLSDYLGRVTDIIFKHGGTVDKFIGDAVMAIFGAPKSNGDDALRAVTTGLAMIEMADSLGSKWAEVIGQPLKIGVGINSGDAVVGSIGSEIRSDFTAIGDTVNLASRLEALTKELRVPMLVSEYTAAEIKEAIPLKCLRQVKVTGRESPLLVYTPEVLLQGEPAVEDDGTPYVQQHK